ncbi:MAG: hypothetical protein ABT02_19595 [Comamonadaceae bacterium SCN 68-20]|mgnify:CR=1 FL=1|jgi:transcriptional regulator with XRE-family HTH domain|nr:MAG: hypothetical protein ABT02_19595 [Comamonadaceae bacterium SCN 68-20]OJX14155.1 MAG: hypothetical protein BGO75_14290 [Burkholderiales bacterium 68-20]UJB65687.1 transcriptional regulator [Acidovorax sp. YS12]
MTPTQEPDGASGFAQRLHQALQSQGKRASPAALEREFNLRYLGKPVTSHAVRKWLLGQSLPTQDKLQVLARWLDVDESWLRWGYGTNGAYAAHQAPGSARPSFRNAPALTLEDASLLQDWSLLEPPHRRVVRAVIETLLVHQRDSAAG